MKKNVLISLGLVVAVLIAAVVIANITSEPDAVAQGSTAEVLVRPDSQRLSTAADGKVTFVEFLDFECESCRAAYPAVEQLREQYDGRVTFVVRHFPLHFNSEAAARAAEAAGAQGKFEEMYQMLFETQSEWGEQKTPMDDVFIGFAEDLGLDMVKFNEDFNDPATLAKVQRDQADGKALGVTGTPTFFLNGTKVEAMSGADLVDQIDAALGS